MLNNKGQSLILFLVILPIVLLILVLLIDIGKVIVLKQELDNINKIALDYGLDNLDNNNLNDELTNIINLNNPSINNINIRLENDKLYIVLDTRINGTFSSLVDISIFDVNSSFVGYIENDEKRIERVSGD